MAEPEPGDVFRGLRRRYRARGALMVIAGIGLAVTGVMSTDDRGAVGALVGVAMAMVGIYWAIWLPVFLRRPEDIARIDLHAPGHKHDMQVVMENGRVCRFDAPLAEREQIKKALETQIGVNRLRARVVRR